VRVGQIATVVLVLVSLSWIPFMRTLMGGGIFHYLQSIQAYISPPIAAVFLLGLYFRWINSSGAIVALWVGFVIGILRLVTEFMSKEGIIILSEGSPLDLFLGINFLHFAVILFLFCGVLMMLVSKLGRQQSDEALRLTTFQPGETAFKFKVTMDGVLTIALILMVLFLWVLFSPLGIG